MNPKIEDILAGWNKSFRSMSNTERVNFPLVKGERIPLIDQGMELAKLMQTTNSAEEVAELLKQISINYQIATTAVFIVGNQSK